MPARTAADVKTNPQPGDVVKFQSILTGPYTRTVGGFSGGYFYYTATYEDGSQLQTTASVRDWRKWVKDAEVITIAGGADA